MTLRLPLFPVLVCALAWPGCGDDDSNEQGAYCDALCARTDECGLLGETQCLESCGREGDAQCENDIDRDACIEAIRTWECSMIGYGSPPECECVTGDGGTPTPTAGGSCEALLDCCDGLMGPYVALDAQCRMAATLGEETCATVIESYQDYCE